MVSDYLKINSSYLNCFIFACIALIIIDGALICDKVVDGITRGYTCIYDSIITPIMNNEITIKPVSSDDILK